MRIRCAQPPEVLVRGPERCVIRGRGLKSQDEAIHVPPLGIALGPLMLLLRMTWRLLFISCCPQYKKTTSFLTCCVCYVWWYRLR